MRWMFFLTVVPMLIGCSKSTPTGETLEPVIAYKTPISVEAKHKPAKRMRNKILVSKKEDCLQELDGQWELNLDGSGYSCRATISSKDACTKASGEWLIHPIFGPECVFFYSDAGKPCENSSQCEGECALESSCFDSGPKQKDCSSLLNTTVGAVIKGACKESSSIAEMYTIIHQAGGYILVESDP